MTTLLSRPIPYPNEAPGSVLLRMSSKNGFMRPSLMISASSDAIIIKNVNPVTYMANSDFWNKLCENFGILEDDVKSGCYLRGGPTQRANIDFYGSSIAYEHLRLKNPAICPECLRSKSYLPKKWDHILITCCSQHGIELVNTCDGCSSPLSWNRKDVSSCSCGYNLALSAQKIAKLQGTIFIEDLIKHKKSDELRKICCIYTALSKMFVFLVKAISPQKLVSLSILSITNRDKLDAKIRQHAKLAFKTKGWHPRITLSGFLCGHNYAKDYVAPILEQLSAYNITPRETPSCLKSSKTIGYPELSIILGLNQLTLTFLANEGYLEKEQILKKGREAIYLSSINKLLQTFSQNNNKIESYRCLESILNLPNTALDKFLVLKEILNGVRKTTSMDFSRGVLSCKIKWQTPIKKVIDYLTLRQVSSFLEVHYENIRFAVHSGILEYIDPKKTQGTTIYIDKQIAHDFKEKYISSGTLARKLNCNPTNFSEKLISLGIKPISGPDIDGGLTYLFLKCDVTTISEKQIKNITNYKTKTGRKLKIISIERSISLASVSNALNISHQKVLILQRKGLLEKVESNSRMVMYTRKSFLKIQSIIENKLLLTITEAAKLTGETFKQFQQRWLDSKFAPVVDIGIERYIKCDDFSKIYKFKEKFITAVEAGELTSTHRNHMKNLETMGKIKPAKQLLSRGRKIKFYDRAEVLYLYKMS